MTVINYNEKIDRFNTNVNKYILLRNELEIDFGEYNLFVGSYLGDLIAYDLTSNNINTLFPVCADLRDVYLEYCHKFVYMDR